MGYLFSFEILSCNFIQYLTFEENLDCTEKNVRVWKQTCSPSVAKFAERMEEETMIPFLENLSTQDDSVIVENFQNQCN